MKSPPHDYGCRRPRPLHLAAARIGTYVRCEEALGARGPNTLSLRAIPVCEHHIRGQLKVRELQPPSCHRPDSRPYQVRCGRSSDTSSHPAEQFRPQPPSRPGSTTQPGHDAHPPFPHPPSGQSAKTYPAPHAQRLVPHLSHAAPDARSSAWPTESCSLPPRPGNDRYQNNGLAQWGVLCFREGRRTSVSAVARRYGRGRIGAPLAPCRREWPETGLWS